MRSEKADSEMRSLGYLTPPEAADRSHRDVSTIHRWIRAGLVKFKTHGPDHKPFFYIEKKSLDQHLGVLAPNSDERRRELRRVRAR